MKYAKLVTTFLITFGLISTAKADIDVNFKSADYTFTEQEKTLIKNLAERAEARVRTLLPAMSKKITLNVVTTNRNLDIVGGVFGRADAPGVIEVTLSTASKGGVSGSAQSGLTSSLFHEMHHLVNGWTMEGNHFGHQPGIPIAAVNEGLASVFAETYTDEYFAEAYDYPDEAPDWLDEIMKLPKDANYAHWVGGFHPDGRSVIGYRVGRYIVHQAMAKTGKDVLQLSQLHPNQILDLVLERVDL